ncbi:MAG TPA: LytTR family DNA-binding domain-containing protein [Tenuifilaceae bacterium]|nr:LytTR family DNA-binding domain-containing protein [Tenuifilaceae bacterium]HPE19381.1 LytTR family DNA-binding domain-containing protein [Tenuifilaceae bacterium]HPJ46990.1 LytTR family DNA-binding domain-containing protein [Tenuifilaceae bacterium]HPQ33251.1 LytTR family DNA-binding domain-containing protein [Tenuifilaceae bacterium]HRX69258.1 LytTR family DNA-binding domain-containing protein [Tenuifilaceae bacterium]
MKCIIVDDDEMSRRLLEDYVSKTNFLILSNSFSNAIDAINFVGEGNEVNLIFLDIEMPEMTGIEFLNTLALPPQVIIVSSKEKYAVDAFDYDVTDYLLKPINYARFFKAVSKASENFNKSKNVVDGDKEIFIKKSNALVKIKYNDILWVEALENYVVINTVNDKFTIHFTMKSIETQLPDSMFKRVHRSFIVNIKHIFSIEDNSIIVKTSEGKKSIPIGKSYRDKLLREINLMNK